MGYLFPLRAATIPHLSTGQSQLSLRDFGDLLLLLASRIVLPARQQVAISIDLFQIPIPQLPRGGDVPGVVLLLQTPGLGRLRR